jgi:hypothetical protein
MGEMSAELLIDTIIISFIIGLIIGLFTQILFEGNPVLKIIIDVSGFIVCAFALLALMPATNADASVAQVANDMSNFLSASFGILIPYVAGDLAGTAGYSILDEFI